MLTCEMFLQRICIRVESYEGVLPRLPSFKGKPQALVLCHTENAGWTSLPDKPETGMNALHTDNEVWTKS